MENPIGQKYLIIEIINYPKIGDFVYVTIQNYDKTVLERIWCNLSDSSDGMLDATSMSNAESNILVITEENVWAVYNKIIIKRERSVSSFRYDLKDEFKNTVFELMYSSLLIK